MLRLEAEEGVRTMESSDLRLLRGVEAGIESSRARSTSPPMLSRARRLSLVAIKPPLLVVLLLLELLQAVGGAVVGVSSESLRLRCVRA